MRSCRELFWALFYLLIILPLNSGYFGLTAKDQMLTEAFRGHDNRIDDGGPRTTEKICDMMKLHRRQKKICRRGTGIAQSLLDATRLSIYECQYQFKNERWNCSLAEPHHSNIIRKGFKETSFLYAMSSASLVHEFARACSTGRLDRCTCDESKALNDKEAWRWGGCGDNVKFGLKFSRRFLRRAKRRGKDHRAKVNLHNSKLGIKVVRNNVNTTCKCHGVSGSCTVKTCWRQLSPFHHIGNILKQKYEKSYKVEVDSNISNGKPPLIRSDISNEIKKDSTFLLAHPNDMVYIDDSPSFCQKSRYSLGTQGRECDKDKNCDAICCGRGYNVQSLSYNRSCACQVVWCCEFHCKQCLITEEVHLCK